MKKAPFILLLLLLLPLSVHSEDTWHDIGRQAIPRTPEAAAYDKVTDIPVSMYNGKADFSIPLYTVSSGDISLPISLDYDGSAIRVDQEATWVGLNWNLNAGGCITVHNVAGHTNHSQSNVKEEGYDSCWNHLFNEMVYKEGYASGGEFLIPYKFNGIQPGRGQYGFNWFSNDNIDPYDVSRKVYDDILNYHNGERPVFHASFLGNSLTFVWDPFREEFFQTGMRKNFRIEGKPGVYIILTDGRGVEYYFSQKEQVMDVSSLADMDHFTYDGTFYLEYIKSPSGHSISLLYDGEDSYYPVRHISETLYDKEYPYDILYDSYCGSGSTPTATTDVKPDRTLNGLSLVRSISPYYCIRKVRLREIRADGVIVRFNANTVRKDLNYGSTPKVSKKGIKRLDNIEIFKTEGEDKKVLKRYDFDYGYFQKDTIGGNTLKDYWKAMAPSVDVYHQFYPDDDFVYLRLRLDRLTEYGSDGTSKPSYDFFYNGSLPGKNSAAQDYWGYYNGQENKNGIPSAKGAYDKGNLYHTLLPRHYQGVDDGIDVSLALERHLDNYGADRRTNFRYSGAGLLRTVVFPTGGTIDIKYRQNTFTNYCYESADTAEYIGNYFSKNITKYTTTKARSLTVSTCDHEKYSPVTQRNISSSVFTLDNNDSLSFNCLYSTNISGHLDKVIGHRIRIEKTGSSTDINSTDTILHTIAPMPDTCGGGTTLEIDTAISFIAGTYKVYIEPLAEDSVYDDYCRITCTVTAERGMLTYDRKVEAKPDYHDLPTLGTSTTVSKRATSSVMAYQSNQTGFSIPEAGHGVQSFLVEKPQYVDFKVNYCKNDGQGKAYWSKIVRYPVMLHRYDIGSNLRENFEYVCETRAIMLSPGDTLKSDPVKEETMLLQPGRYSILVPSINDSGKDGVFYEIISSVSLQEKSKQWKAPSYGNGVCVSSLVRTDNDTANVTSYNYYTSDGWNSTGRLSSPVIFARKKMLVYQDAKLKNPDSELDIGNEYPRAKEIVYACASSDNMCSNGSMVGYDRASRSVQSHGKVLSREVNTFWNKNWVNGSLWYFIPTPEDPRNGLVLTDSTFDAGRLQKTVSQDYKIENTESRLINASIDNLYYGPTGSLQLALASGGGIMDICVYANAQFVVSSSEGVTSTSCEGGQIEQSRRTTFNKENGQPSSETISTSIEGGSETTDFLYPCDYHNLPMADSLNKVHIIEVPLQVTTFVNGSGSSILKGSTVTEYNGQGQPTDYYTKDIDGAISKSSFVTTNKNGFDLSGYTRRLSIAYDGNTHNPLTFTGQGGLKTELTWGYHDLYPVSVSKGGLTTRYEYDPYVGMTKMTQPNGNTESYAYDGFQRLAKVSGIDGVTHRYSYHYGQNYIKQVQPLDASESTKATSIQYYDGLGRPTLSASDGISGNGTGVYTLKTYDGLDRAVREYLPAVGDGGTGYISDNDFSAKSKATYNDSHAYSETSYDALNRPAYTQTAGEAWHSAKKGIKKEYVTNSSNSVKLYTAPMDGTNHMVKSGYYAPCTLFGERTIDEDGHSLTVFTDKLGQKVLERRASEQGNNDTYFVYNDLGQLRFVLSPEYQNDQHKAIFGYEYRYDKRGNMTKKILPQCQYIQYWYDNADRLTFMQDANLRSKNKYRFMLYDRLGRLCLQGLCDDFDRSVSVSETNLSVEYKQGSEGLCNTGYVLNNPLSLKNASLGKACYYDSYDFLSGSRKAAFVPVTPTILGYSSVNVIGRQTGAILYASDGQYLYEAKAYDKKGREVESRSITANGSVEDVKSEYTFTDNIAKQTSSVSKDGSVVVSSVTTNEYNNHNNKVASTNIAINDGTQQKSCNFRYEYDDLGRLKATYRPYKAGDVSYGYNLHGWTTSISTPTFTEKLYYADDISYGNHYYNGNICAQRWTNGNYSPSRWYKFSYDMLNRLTDAEYSENDSHEECQNYYDESILKYDANGNIERLQRRGRKQDGHVGKIDNLHIYHKGNQLDRVKDDADKIYYAGIFNFNGDDNNEAHYKYNDSGSLTEDTGRGITNIEYDDFNNPRRIQFSNGNVTKYVYSADGEKLRMDHYTAAPNITVAQSQTHELLKGEILSVDSTDYIGCLVMKNGRPDMYLFAGGYYAFTSSCASTNSLHAGEGREEAPVGGTREGLYFYNYDHLGNVREVVNEDGELEQVNNYYPFGAPFSDNSITAKNPDLQPYKYTGKELDLVHGLNTYDHGARQNYSILGVWDKVDPLAEETISQSPYMECNDNPINYIDPFGLDYWRTNDSKEIDAFISSIKKGDKYFDCSNWQHVSDNDFLSKAFYNDETGKFYVSWNCVEDNQIFCYSKSFDTKIKINTSIDTKLLDFIDNSFGTAGACFGRLSTADKSRKIYNIRKSLKASFGYKMPYTSSQIYRSWIPKFFKYGGRFFSGLSIIIDGKEIIQNKTIRASNALDLTMTFVGAIPVYGWAIGGAYFLIDSGLDFATGKGVGENINSIYGNDGVLYEFR